MFDSERETEESKQTQAERWIAEIGLASERERKWRESAKRTVERYREESPGENSSRRLGTETEASRFNILWSNVQIQKASLYQRTPIPDVRRRYPQPDPMARAAAELLERALSYSVDAYDFDHVMNLMVSDLLLPGRAVARVRYNPTIEEGGKRKSWETVTCEAWPWARFRVGPGMTWEQVPWIAYEHLMRRDELKDKFPKDWKDIELDTLFAGSEGEERVKKDPDVFKRGRVWEIWDKDTRRVLWVAPSCKDRILKDEGDKLGLEDFFDTPRPMYAIESSDSTVPIDEYRLYRAQAVELDAVTRRITGLIAGLRFRGIYDSVMQEMEMLTEAGDNQFIPASTAGTALAQTGALERHIWMWPIETCARVLVNLYQQRDQIKQTIYEIVGLSDIMRGASDPNETLGAQQIKAQSGSIRLREKVEEVQRYARDLYRLKGEIIAERFDVMTLSVMTGVPPQVVAQVKPMLEEDGPRGFRVDIETDSTIAAEQQADTQAMAELMQGIGTFFQSLLPAVQTGAFPAEVAKEMLLAAVRRMRLGRHVEVALEQAAQEQPQQQQPAAEEQAAASEPSAADMAKMQADAQIAQADMQLKGQEQQIRTQLEAKKLEQRDAELQLAAAEQAHKHKIDEARAQMDFARLLRETETGDQERVEAVDSAALAARVEDDMREMAQAVMALAQTMRDGFERQAETQERLIAVMSAPRQLVRDEEGRPVGVQVEAQH